LLAYLATVSDPRRRAGRRHPLVAILGLAAAAVLGVHGRSPRSPSGPPTHPSRSVPRSAPAAEQASPARLADYIRGHWAIGNGLHYLRDVTLR
jgi:hypothetical protein